MVPSEPLRWKAMIYCMSTKTTSSTGIHLVLLSGFRSNCIQNWRNCQLKWPNGWTLLVEFHKYFVQRFKLIDSISYTRTLSWKLGTQFWVALWKQRHREVETDREREWQKDRESDNQLVFASVVHSIILCVQNVPQTWISNFNTDFFILLSQYKIPRIITA